jgi:hypothetical protein
MTKLTDKQADALVAIYAASGTATYLRESNAPGDGTIYWQHVQALTAADLIEVRGAQRHLFTTRAGAALAYSIRPHAPYLAHLGYEHDGRLLLRRMGSGTTHLAPVEAPRFYRASVLGSDCLLAVHDPVVAACGARLRGEVVVMEATTRIGCAACRRFA